MGELTFETNGDVFWCYDFHGDLGLVLVQHQVLFARSAILALSALNILFAVLGIILVAV